MSRDNLLPMRLFRSLPLAALLVACSAPGTDKTSALPGTDAATEEDTSTEPGEDSGSSTEDGGLVADALPPVDAKPGGDCKSVDDCDGDGYKKGDDCNDNDATINPDAYDFPDDKIDNDCNGTVDDPVEACAPALSATDAPSYARAIDLCAQKKATLSGKPFDPLVKAEFGTVSGAGSKLVASFFGMTKQSAGTVTLPHHPSATKILSGFGSNPARTGGAFALLSTGPSPTTDPRGPAIEKSDRWMTKSGKDPLLIDDGCKALGLDATDCTALTGGTSAPGGKVAVTDLSELKLTIKVPSNAKSLSFDFAFFSTEFNEFWKTNFNDGFFALVKSKAIAGKNVAKDAKGQGITVNSGFFQLCPAPPGPKGLQKAAALSSAPCVGVAGDPTKLIFGTLAGTNFDGAGIGSTDDTVQSFLDNKKYIYGGGSGWLTAKFGVEPGETIELRLLVVDAGDGILDSAVLVDNVKWEKAPPKVITGEVERPPR